VEFILGAASAGQFPEPLGREIAFMGRSNSGKSSLLNRLLGRKAMARVSSEPGRTREINFFKVVWRKGQEPFYVADFPGYGFARAPKDKVRGWGALAGGYLAGGRGQKSFLLADIRRRLGDDEFMLLDLFRKLGSPAVMVATKCDKVSKAQRAAALSGWRSELPPEVPLLCFSALTGEGREELIAEAMPPAGPGGFPGPFPEAGAPEEVLGPRGPAPAVAVIEPGPAGPDPGAAGHDPGPAGPDPGAAGHEPGAAGPDPGAAGPDPAAAGHEPGAAGSGQEEDLPG
jgi:GTP-binding protein